MWEVPTVSARSSRSRGGAVTTIYAFVRSGGAGPNASLVQGTDGNFYGTTGNGGAINYGTVFKFTPAGALTKIYSFSGSDGAYPSAGLEQGTTEASTERRMREVQAVSARSSRSRLRDADDAPPLRGERRGHPHAGLVQGTDGNFYGTTSSGGASTFGTVFTITPTGTLTTLHDFAGATGQVREPVSYGVPTGTSTGRRIKAVRTPTAPFSRSLRQELWTTLHDFAGSDGASPRAGLAQGTDGNFYGTTQQGGANANGTVFRITPAGR